MFSNRSSSLLPPNNNNHNDQYLGPDYSYDRLLVPPSSYVHHQSEPNVALYFDNQAEQRRLSDGPYPALARRPYTYHYYHHPGEFTGNEPCMLKRKNSSLNIILDSTSSMMRTASSTVQCLIGSAHRASYCGQPDPSVQLAPNGVSGSLYLRSTTANSNESSLSTSSYDEQKRHVTIYDGCIPTTPFPPKIPFELMTPFDVITKSIDDPLESFVQIVLEKPDDRPPIIPPMLTSPIHMNSPDRCRRRSSSPRLKINQPRPPKSIENTPLPKLTQHQFMPVKDSINSNESHCQTSDVIEPMDFSFLEPVLRGESAAPPPPPPPMRNQSLSLLNKKSINSRISLQNSSATEDSAIDLNLNPPSSYSSNHVTTIEDDLVSSESSSGDNHNYYLPYCPRSHITPFTG
ncbi:unnamed protein product [Rotaria magnacalcarata]|uniref:Uncharacterized protein n=1 Tax=Rotaria magnacalcarata TaxID=392030 RepID=A0A817AHV5_9BILA|nr:unnamed protein product [Rotaria magnacalcarata]CAF1656044.1 unnamed protein product [Rotaria magnacalcarata]CAF2268650.1 unnamed protein product [Rotaria magnacalcarata]CAF3821262.1 unnamed protein product [Rotaria magnacalcarata]CAF3870358.1 unnamed protein product [Rotaria magnacalcarata]